jgi:hypothetical protein
MSRPGYPQSSTVAEIAADNLVTVSNGAVEQRNWVASYKNYEADSIGANTPGWPNRKQTNGYVGYRVNVNAQPAHVSGEISGFPGGPVLQKVDGTYPMTWLSGGYDPIAHYGEVPDVSPTDMKSELFFKIQSKIKDQKVNMGVAAFEFKKTCQQVTSNATRIAQALRQVARGDLGGGLKTLGGGRKPKRPRGGGGGGGSGKRPKPTKPPGVGNPNANSIAADWLSIQYGWKPLLSDIYGATEELARTLTFEPEVFSATASVQKQGSLKVDLAPIAPWCPPIRGSLDVNASMKGTVVYGITSDFGRKLANTGVANPLAIAWELVPYSFVADWFLPVGTFLNNLDFDLGLFFMRGWASYRSRGSSTLRPVSGEYSGGFGPHITERWSGGQIHSHVEYFSRDSLVAFPALQYPQWKDPRSLLHATNAIALVVSAVGGGNPKGARI